MKVKHYQIARSPAGVTDHFLVEFTPNFHPVYTDNLTNFLAQDGNGITVRYITRQEGIIDVYYDEKAGAVTL